MAFRNRIHKHVELHYSFGLHTKKQIMAYLQMRVQQTCQCLTLGINWKSERTVALKEQTHGELKETFVATHIMALN